MIQFSKWAFDSLDDVSAEFRSAFVGRSGYGPPIPQFVLPLNMDELRTRVMSLRIVAVMCTTIADELERAANREESSK